MNRTKEVFDSGFTLDDIFQESIDLNNLVLTNKSNETKYENILKFFSNNSIRITSSNEFNIFF